MMIYKHMYSLIILSYDYVYRHIYIILYIYIHALYQILINPTSVGKPSFIHSHLSGTTSSQISSDLGGNKKHVPVTNESVKKIKSAKKKKKNIGTWVGKRLIQKNMTFRIHFKKIWMKNMIRDWLESKIDKNRPKTLCSCATTAANSSAAGPPPIAATAKGPACCGLSSNMLISFQKSLGQFLNIDVWAHELESSAQVWFTVGSFCCISVQVDLKDNEWALSLAPFVVGEYQERILPRH